MKLSKVFKHGLVAGLLICASTVVQAAAMSITLKTS